jgi:hypothetical protein
MEKLASNLSLAIQLGSKGYLQSENGDIPGITQHVKDIEDIYKKAIKERGNQHVA